jgi:hypothetical protein
MKAKALLQVLLQCNDDLDIEFVVYPSHNIVERYTKVESITEVSKKYSQVPSTTGKLQIELVK